MNPGSARAGRSIKVPIDTHTLIQRIALDLAPHVGRVVQLAELVSAMARVTDRDRAAVLAELKGANA